MFSTLKKFAFRKFKASEVKLHELNYLFWECTTRCNLNCLHCGSDCSKDGSVRDMPFNDLLAALDTIKLPSNNLTVVLTGGEPLLRNDIERCGREIRKRGMRWSLVSNGHLYDEKRHVSLLNAGLGALTISLDGLETTHNWLRNNGSGFQKVSDAIDLAVGSSRLNFDIVTCVNKRNIDELAQIRDFLVQKGVRSWRLFTIIPIGRAKHNDDLQLTDDQFLRLMDFIATSRNNKIIDVRFSCEGFVGKYESKVRDSYFFCRAGINIGSVLIDGSISACPNVDRSFSQGDIYRDNFYEIWQKKFEPFRDRNWSRVGQCAGCRDYKDCQGNGFHNWHYDIKNVLICHNKKLERAIKDQIVG